VYGRDESEAVCLGGRRETLSETTARGRRKRRTSSVFRTLNFSSNVALFAISSLSCLRRRRGRLACSRQIQLQQRRRKRRGGRRRGKRKAEEEKRENALHGGGLVSPVVGASCRSSTDAGLMLELIPSTKPSCLGTGAETGSEGGAPSAVVVSFEPVALPLPLPLALPPPFDESRSSSQRKMTPRASKASLTCRSSFSPHSARTSRMRTVSRASTYGLREESTRSSRRPGVKRKWLPSGAAGASEWRERCLRVAVVGRKRKMEGEVTL
jgi:hypothetical protein